MTVPFWCVLVVIFLPYVATVLTVGQKKVQFGTADNKLPRVQAARLSGRGARVWGAHQNALEARAPFAAAVIIAHIAGADAGQSAIVALAFVGIRAAHLVAYVSDLSTLRSVLFAAGMACVLYLFILAAMAG